MQTRSKLVALVAFAATLVLPGTALAAYRYRGSTSQQEYVSFLLSKRVTQISKFQIDWDATCTSGATLADGTALPRMRMGRSLRFLSSGSYSYTMVNSGYSAGAGRNLDFEVKGAVSGRLTRSGNMRGTWQATVTVIDPTMSQTVDSCSTGHVRWTALLL
jgi:hypothetical protein